MYDAEAVRRYAQTPNGRAKRLAAHKRWRDAHPEYRPVAAARGRQYRQADPHRDIFNLRRLKSKRLGIPFSLVQDDVIWPEYCPVLGIKLDYTRTNKCGLATDNVPSFDRVVQGGDYSPDNVLIVSNRANTLRGAATVDQLCARSSCSNEHRKVYLFYKTLLSDLFRENSHLPV